MRIRSLNESKNFNGKIFINSIPTKLFQSGKVWSTFFEMIRDRKKREPKLTPGPFPVDLPSLGSVADNEISFLWMGHSTLLIFIEGSVFLTDPVWAKRASPFSFAGPKRFFEAPLKIDELPNIDGIILSHDHFDHLDSTAIRLFGEKGIPFYCPIGVGGLLAKWNIPESQIREFDWWEEFTTDSGIQLISTPARHFSGRSIINRNKTLWTSWVIKGKSHNIFFGGDSGYFPGFRSIGDKFGPFDISMLEIGAYHPNWGSIHLGPQNAIKAHLDLNSKIMLPIHWGLFNLALHGWTEPVEEIINLAKINKVNLCLPSPGALIKKDHFEQISCWWRNNN